jgi:phosphopantothenoylcysteine decarboxylase/phosphopantothenate--cysteine ligase
MPGSDNRHSPLRIALGVTGGIAAYKSVEVLRGLQRNGCEVRVAMTRHACEFIRPLTFRALSGSYVLVDDYAAHNPDPIAHITFSQSVNLFVIAPATANTLAKLANGIADDFITSTYLACTAPVLVAPAMNTVMWQHPATQRNIERLQNDGVFIIAPDEGEMACRTIGPGRLSEPERIVARAMEILAQGYQEQSDVRRQSAPYDLANETIVITAGATREAIDPVRFISNRSSGRMGFAIAEAARQRGAKVHLVAGITSAKTPAGISLARVTSAEEMRAATMSAMKNATALIAAAAVSDYRVGELAQSKIKKHSTELTLTLERTPDILAEVARNKGRDQIIVGFAAETDDLISNARAKLVAKDLDMIVANDVSREDSGFESDENVVTLLLRDRIDPIELPRMPKIQVAHKILDQIVKWRSSVSLSKSA